MNAYIKLLTGEYPRHEGDIAVDPDGASAYAEVQWIDRPTYNPATQRCEEGLPTQIDGQWQMTWVVRDATPEEIEYINRPMDLQISTPNGRFVGAP
jgi:hypothetical protein